MEEIWYLDKIKVSMKKFQFLTFLFIFFVTFSIHAESKKIVHFKTAKGDIYYGLVNDGKVQQLAGNFNDLIKGDYRTVDNTFNLSSVKILPPVMPSKVINFGWTYPEHAKEVGGEANRKEPLVFLKPQSVIIGDGDNIIYPRKLSKSVQFEGELAIVIGKKARNVTPANALKYVFGYTCFNDVTARDLQKSDPQYTRGKGFDTFGPLGPWIVTDIDPAKLHLTTRLNGRIKQDGNTSQMTFKIPYLISFVSQFMTLEPGDVLATGTPSGSDSMRIGDVVEVEIEKIGVLKNYIK